MINKGQCMGNIIKIENLEASELDIYARLSD